MNPTISSMIEEMGKLIVDSSYLSKDLENALTDYYCSKCGECDVNCKVFNAVSMLAKYREDCEELFKALREVVK